MNLFQNISWADFLITAIPLLIIFNAAVFVYYRSFYKGDKETPKDKKFDNDTTSSSFEVEDEDEDVTFVSYDDEADEDDYIQKDPDDVEDKEQGNEQEAEDWFGDVDADMFFADGEVLDDKYREDVEMAFQELGYNSQEEDLEGVDFCDDGNLYEASIKAFNVQNSEIDEIDDVFLGIVEKLEEIQEKNDEEQLSMHSESPSVDDDFFGSELEDDLNV